MAGINKIIKRMISTEKSIRATEGQNTYTFEVHNEASKGAVINEVSGHYKVDVESVNLMVVPGKKRRLNRTARYIRTPKWKKALVTLKEGQKIENVKEEEKEDNK